MPDQRDELSTEQVALVLRQLLAGGRKFSWIKKRIADAGIPVAVSDQSLRDFIHGDTKHPHAKVIDPLRAACLRYAWHLHADADDLDDRSTMYRGMWRFVRPESQDILNSATATYRVFIQSQEFKNYVVAGVLRVLKKDDMFFFEEFQKDDSVPVDEIHEGIVFRKDQHNYFISTENRKVAVRLVITIETWGATGVKIPEFRGRVFGVSTSHSLYHGPYIMKLLYNDNKDEQFELAKESCYRKREDEVPSEDKDIVLRLKEMML